MRRQLSKTFDGMLRALAYAGGGLFFLMMLALSYEVVMRYFFIRPTSWAVDFSTYAMFAAVFLGAAWVLAEDAHTKIDVIVARLNPKTQAVVNCVTSFFCILLCAILLWKSGQVTWELYQSGETFFSSTRIFKYIIVVFLPLGAFLLCIQFARRTRQYLSAFRTQRSE